MGVRFDAFELDLETGELERDARRLKLQPQPTRLLTLLVRNAGSIVTREQIQRELWPDGTIVDYDQSINYCIKRIRETLSDDSGKPRIIETVPRRGYRFIASIEEPRKRALAPHVNLWGVAVASGAAIGLLAAALALWRQPVPMAGFLESAPVTTLVGYEGEPALSPNGRLVAFTWNGSADDGVFQLFVKPVASEELVRLTDGPGDVYTPAWHPDGSQIAFVRHVVAPEGSGNRLEDAIFVVPALGGRPRKIGTAGSSDGHHGLSWAPDGIHLAVRDQEKPGGPSAILLLSTTSGERIPVTHPPPDSRGDVLPAMSPDGAHVAFARLRSNRRGDLFVQPIAGGEARRLSDVDAVIGGIGWADEVTVLFTSAERFGVGGTLWRARLDGDGPEEVMVREEPSELSVAGRRLVYSVPRRVENVWKAPGPSSSGTSAPSRFIASTRDDIYPQVSPDGSQVLFTSNRSGEAQVWLYDVATRQSTQLTREGGIFASWSPSGTQIAFAIYDPAVGRAGLGVMAATGGFPITASPPEPRFSKGHPSWSNDERWIYSYGGPATSSDSRLVFRVSVANGGLEPVTSGRRPLQSENGRLFFSRDRNIWSLDGDTESLVVADRVPAMWWTVWKHTLVYIQEDVNEGASIEVLDLETDETRTLVELGTGRYFGDGVSVFPDGSAVLYTELELDGDLMTAELRH